VKYGKETLVSIKGGEVLDRETAILSRWTLFSMDFDVMISGSSVCELRK
jgi:hypothetical protein